jgi:signal transduction histidine kinase/Tfp pilus assembly protein PilF
VTAGAAVLLALGLLAPPAGGDGGPPGASFEELLAASTEATDSDPARSQTLAEAALELARRGADPERRARQEVRALNRLGVARYAQGEFEEAFALLSETRRLAEEAGDRDTLANALNNLGILHYFWGDLERALEHYQQALALRREDGDRIGLAKAYNNLGAVAHAAERYDDALEYYRGSLAVYEELGDRVLVASSHNNIGLALLHQNRLEEARSHFDRALALATAGGDLAGVAASENHRGLVFQEAGRLDEARGALERALALRRQLGDRPGTAVALLNLGSVAASRGDLAAAMGHLENARALAAELDIPQLLRDSYQHLADLQARQGRHREALDTFRRYHEVHARLVNDQSRRQLSSLRALFELEKKNREIDRLSRAREAQRRVQASLLGATALLSAIVVLLFSRNRIQTRAHREISRKNEQLEQAHRELERASRAEVAHLARVVSLGELTAAVAHELNQPLAAIVTNAQLAAGMLRQEEGPGGRPVEDGPRGNLEAELEGALEDIRLGASRAWDLLRHLRQLARRGEVERSHLDLAPVLDQVIQIAGAEARMKGVTLVLEPPREPLAVSGDPVHLQQVVLNLVQNALAAVTAVEPPSLRRVVVRARGDETAVTVTVEDSGPPVAAEVLAEMFKPFFTTRPDGLGMGLAISKRLVEAHHGELWARHGSERGLVVGFRLPRAGRGGPAPLPAVTDRLH